MSAPPTYGVQALERFHYDSMDRVAAALASGQPGSQRFYKEAFLANTFGDGQQRCHLRMGDHLLGVRDTGAAVNTLALLGTEQQGSVLRASLPGATRVLAYTPYGEGADPLLLGFNGQQPEPASGYYLLGNGYRAYNPRLMRFNSPDSFSPFEGAGLNPYTYCLGDPINRSDPTGHMSMGAWLGVAAGIVAVVIGVVIIGAVAGPAIAAAIGSGAGATVVPPLTIGGMAAIVSGALTIGSGGAGIASAGLREKDPYSDFATNMGWVSTGLAVSAAVLGGVTGLSKAYDKALKSAFGAYANAASPKVSAAILPDLASGASSLLKQLQSPRVISAVKHFGKDMVNNLRPRLPRFGKPKPAKNAVVAYWPEAGSASSAPPSAPVDPSVSAQASRIRGVVVP